MIVAGARSDTGHGYRPFMPTTWKLWYLHWIRERTHGRLHDSREWLRALNDDAGVRAIGVHERVSIKLSHPRRDGKINGAT